MEALIILLIVMFVGKKILDKYNNNNYYNEKRYHSKPQIYKPIQKVESKKNDYIDTAKSPFLMAHSLLTATEMNFYKVLRNIINQETQVICPKVRMQDVLWTKTYYVENKQVFMNKVNRKHFDFVICDASTLKPLYAVELDDKTHEEEDRKERDEFVDALFKGLKFNVIHIKVQVYYNLEELKEKITLKQSIDVSTISETVSKKVDDSSQIENNSNAQ